MGKESEVKPLPPTKAETAEKRLEELVSNKSVSVYEYLGTKSDKALIIGGGCRVYPDGFEAVVKGDKYPVGYLHVERRNFYVCYELDTEYKKQNNSDMKE